MSCLPILMIQFVFAMVTRVSSGKNYENQLQKIVCSFLSSKNSVIVMCGNKS